MRARHCDLAQPAEVVLLHEDLRSVLEHRQHDPTSVQRFKRSRILLPAHDYRAGSHAGDHRDLQ